MKMKKIIATALVFALSMGSTVFASEAGPTPENNTADIKATYNADEPEPATVYSVDVAWGSLEYTYSSGTTRSWNPETLKFEETEGTPEWSCATEADTITVTNHSNAGIKASFTYEETNSSGISGSFSQAAVVLGAAQEDTARDAAPSGQTTLSLNGDLTDTTAVKEKIGQVTVKISGETPVVATADMESSWHDFNDSMPIYSSSQSGVYVATYTHTATTKWVAITFKIDNQGYGTRGGGVEGKSGQLEAGNSSAFVVLLQEGKTYKFTFDTINSTWTSEEIS